MVKNRRQADPKHHSAHWSERSGNHFRDGIDNRESDVGDPSGGHPVRSQTLIDQAVCRSKLSNCTGTLLSIATNREAEEKKKSSLSCVIASRVCALHLRCEIW